MCVWKNQNSKKNVLSVDQQILTLLKKLDFVEPVVMKRIEKKRRIKNEFPARNFKFLNGIYLWSIDPINFYGF